MREIENMNKQNVRGYEREMIKYLLEYPGVHRKHNNAGYPKRYRTRHHSIDFIHDEDALVGMLFQPLQMIVCRVPAEEDGCE
jgi:hypothetical protein